MSETIRAYEPSRQFLNCHIAGFSHWDAVEVFDELHVGAPLELRPEPTNPFDPCAIAVWFNETKIGYVPRTHNAELAQLMFFGYGDIFSARVAQVDPQAHPERQARMAIFLKDARG